MSWLKVLALIVQYLPTIISVLKQIVELVEKLDDDKKQNAKTSLRNAFKASRKNKDIYPIARMHRHLAREFKRGDSTKKET